MRKQIMLVCCGLVLASSACVAVTIPEIVSRAKAAVLVIYNLGTDGNPQSFGSGFFISADGLVITNRHVIEGAAQVVAVSVVSGATHQTYQLAGVYFACPNDDLVVLKFYATGVHFLRLGRGPAAVEGQHILVIGNPEGQAGTVSDGLISAFRRDRSLMQISAPISPGSSGSPVLDEKGNVIAVAVAISALQGQQNINYSIPIERLTRAWDAAGHVPQGKALEPAHAAVTPAQDDYSAFDVVVPQSAQPAPQPANASAVEQIGQGALNGLLIFLLACVGIFLFAGAVTIVATISMGVGILLWQSCGFCRFIMSCAAAILFVWLALGAIANTAHYLGEVLNGTARSMTVDGDD